ncbi:MAG: aminodeoxychorismate/anthranilate synthase component II [Candidatus Heimdallarchaeota archaeon]|nr:aminodeoxychorismate/anthranilate synthase component II [Candidatus Heimdallarchaeota archaeon]
MVDIFVIDNIDSFVYNLVQYLGELGQEIQVEMNNVSLQKIRKLKPKKIVISPGPGRPEKAGNCVAIIKEFGKRIPILGVCLGHQCIGYAFGAMIGYAKNLLHGKVSEISHDGKTIYKNIRNPFIATRYHSLVVEASNFPETLEISAYSGNGETEIMGIRHKEYPIEGVQFHPESILTTQGKLILKNFIEMEI